MEKVNLPQLISPDYIDSVSEYEKLTDDELRDYINDINDAESAHEFAGKLPNNPKWTQIFEEVNYASRARLIAIILDIKRSIHKINNQLPDIYLYNNVKNDQEGEQILKKITENWRIVENQIKIAKANPEAFLGNGAVAEVHNLKGSLDGFCFKIIYNYQMYNELDFKGERVQNRIEEEGEFLEFLEDYEVAGVKTPSAYFYISTKEFEGIGMETMDAANFARVFEGHEQLPETFNFDDYFKRLEEYLNALHNKKGILHKDLAARNLMVDRKTGNPIVIDFGRARFAKHFSLSEKETLEEAIKKEEEMFKIVKNDIKEKLYKLNNINN